MRLLPTTQKPLKARNAPSALTLPAARQVPGAGGTVTGLREAVGPAAQYLMLVKLVANTRPTRRVEKPCTKLLKVSTAKYSLQNCIIKGPSGGRENKYSDLLNKRAHPNKRAGRENFFIYYMKNRVQGGKICHLLHKKLLQGGLFFQKC
jgi:hypothetical protein